MTNRIRLTMAQAIVKFLDNQYVMFDGKEEKFVDGIIGIFGHGCVVGVGQALEQGGHNLRFYQGHNEQGMAHVAIGFAKQHNRRMIIPCVSSIGPGAMNMVTACGTASSSACGAGTTSSSPAACAARATTPACARMWTATATKRCSSARSPSTTTARCSGATGAAGGEIWKLPVRTYHVHGGGICADIDPAYHGLEFYGQEVDQSNHTAKNTHPQSDNRWLYTADGTLLCAYTNCFRYGNGRSNLYWDGDLQREIFTGPIKDHDGAYVTPPVPGPRLVADLFGDWREEFITGHKGEIRIYTTDIPALDRRVTLMRDPAYRSRITMATSGYNQQPILTYVPSAQAPNISLRVARDFRSCRLDVVAPLDKPLKGTLVFDGLPEKWIVDLPPQAIDLPQGGIWTRTLKFKRPPNPKGRYDFRVMLERPAAAPLVLHHTACL